MNEAKFWIKVEKRGVNECWHWIGCRSARGYGRFNRNGRTINAHRVAWEIIHRVIIPSGMEICHSCDNPSCVNPSHLWIGTHKENCDDRDRKGRNKSFQGEAHGRAKLTNGIVLEIRNRYAIEPIGTLALAKQYRLNKKTVQQIVKRQLWKHV